MSFLIAGAAVVSAGVGVAKAISGAKAKKKAEAEAEKARAEMNAQKEKFAGLDTSNPYKDFQNMMSENVYEDLTVNKQQAEFQAEQQEQQRANILQNLQGAAGASGIAALAQQMANQGTIQARQAAATIGQQESQQQELKAKGELVVQRGEADVQAKKVEGEIMSRDMERNKIMTLMGMSQQETSAYQQQAAAANEQMWSGISGAAGSLMQGATAIRAAEDGGDDLEIPEK